MTSAKILGIKLYLYSRFVLCGLDLDAVLHTVVLCWGQEAVTCRVHVGGLAGSALHVLRQMIISFFDSDKKHFFLPK